MVLLGYIVLALVSTAVVWVGSGILETSSERLAAYYELPPIVQGAVIAAVGSSFPELSSTVLSTLVHGEFELGVAVIAGSAIFNILVIPGLCGLASKEKTLQANRDLVYKEAQFYMVAVATLLLTFSFAVIYNPMEEELVGGMTRLQAAMPVALYGLYLFIQYQDSMDFVAEEPSTGKPGKQWALLVFSLLIILVGVEGLVRSALGFGRILNTPSFLWGLTVIAAGTSISDAFYSIRAARAGKAVTSIANVLGSNTFDLLVAIPVGVLIAGTTAINYAVAAPLMGFLVLATIILFVLIRINLNLTRLDSYVLLAMYGLFLLWMLLETIGITSLVLS
jgi:cation:H+ antiporter